MKRISDERIEQIVVKRFPSRQRAIKEIGLDETLIDVAQAQLDIDKKELREIGEEIDKILNNYEFGDGSFITLADNLQSLKQKLLEEK